jgi:hypothetical protein
MKVGMFGMIQVGDLVLPVDPREFLFSSPDKVESEEDPIDMIWEDYVIGLVIDVLEFEPQREYYQVRIMVEEDVGWTYSDYVRVIS